MSCTLFLMYFSLAVLNVTDVNIAVSKKCLTALNKAVNLTIGWNKVLETINNALLEGQLIAAPLIVAHLDARSAPGVGKPF